MHLAYNFTLLCIANSNNLKALCIQNGEVRNEEVLENNLKKEREKCPFKYGKNNNAEYYIGKFNIPTVLMAMFTMCVTALL